MSTGPDQDALALAVGEAALNAGWTLLKVTDRQTDKGTQVAMLFEPNLSLYGPDDSVARAKAKVAVLTDILTRHSLAMLRGTDDPRSDG